MKTWVAALALLCSGWAAAQPLPPAVQQAARALAGGTAPFAVVDKPGAALYVFFADGRLAGAAPALLGLARGDGALPGVGRLRHIPPAARTTPAGRYASEPGRNLEGEAIVWLDYDAGLALHRLRPAPAAERRPARLASPTPADNRITLGCVVVEGAFYDAVVAPLLGRRRGTVLVLPEADVAAAL